MMYFLILRGILHGKTLMRSGILPSFIFAIK